jgi:hypothetical protein
MSRAAIWKRVPCQEIGPADFNATTLARALRLSRAFQDDEQKMIPKMRAQIPESQDARQG